MLTAATNAYGILTVRELTDKLKNAIERALPYAWVRGEVTGVSRATSGHLYFSLKDDEALLKCVWFKNTQGQKEHFDPLTGEVFEDGPRPHFASLLRNGLHVVAAGTLNIYSPQGTYQLIIERVQPVGEGTLHLAFEEIKRRLDAKGYFAQERKRPLPLNPSRVALITSPQGAAVHDFIRVAQTRGTGATIRLFPAVVQGEQAPQQLCAALTRIAAEGWAEVVVLIRGGGSAEDLWAFQDEALASALVASPIPVLTGIGHEVDTSIADMVADVRAATPSHAAQLLWPERIRAMQALDESTAHLRTAFASTLYRHHERLNTLRRALGYVSPTRNLARLTERSHALSTRLVQCARRFTAPEQRCLERLTERLVLARESALTTHEHSIRLLATRLHAMNPHAPLARGYSLTSHTDGHFVRSVHDVQSGDALTVRVQDGVFTTIVAESSTS